MTLLELLEKEYSPLRSLNPTAVYQYRLTLTRFGEHLGHDPTLADLAPLPVQAFLSGRKAKVAAGTARKDRTHIVALWGYAAKRRLVEEFPTLPPLKAPARLPRAYKVSEVSQLLRTALCHPGAICGLPASFYWAALVRLAWESAERIGAIRQLRWREVDLEERAVVFLAESRKGATRDIRRQVSPELAGWLAKLKVGRRDQDLVFPWDRNPISLWYDLRKLTAVAGITNRGFHGLRKSAASYVTAAGGDATRLLDHSNPSITRDHYVDESIARPSKTALDYLPPLNLEDDEPETPAP